MLRNDYTTISYNLHFDSCIDKYRIVRGVTLPWGDARIDPLKAGHEEDRGDTRIEWRRQATRAGREGVIRGRVRSKAVAKGAIQPNIDLLIPF